MWSNGLRALDLLGVGDAIRAHGLHRAELHACLLAAVSRDVARTGATVVDVGQTDSAATGSYRTPDGTQGRLSATLVVGADESGRHGRRGTAVVARAALIRDPGQTSGSSSSISR